MPRVHANGIDIHYEVHGDGFPLVFISGLGHGGWSWFRQVNELSRDFMVITFDNRGVGQTDKPATDYSIGMFAEDTLGLLSALGISRAHVCGASMGAHVAQHIAWAHPEAVEKLVLCSSMFGGPNAVPIPGEAMRFLTSRPQGTPSDIVRQGLELATADGFLEGNPDVVEEITRLQLANPQPASAYLRQLAAAAAFLSDASTEAHLAEIAAETLVVAGAKDRVVPPENARLLVERIPRARLALVDGAGHLVFMEKPNEFNGTVRSFLRTRGPGGSDGE